MPFSLRLDPDTEATIRRLTTNTGLSKAQIIREAVGQYAIDRAAPAVDDSSTYDQVKSDVGIIATGGAHYSVDTHRKYRDALRRQARGRRAR